MKIRRVIGTADERTGGDVSKTFSAPDVTVKIELFRGNVAHDRQVFRRRTEILT